MKYEIEFETPEIGPRNCSVTPGNYNELVDAAELVLTDIDNFIKMLLRTGGVSRDELSSAAVCFKSSGGLLRKAIDANEKARATEATAEFSRFFREFAKDRFKEYRFKVAPENRYKEYRFGTEHPKEAPEAEK